MVYYKEKKKITTQTNKPQTIKFFYVKHFKKKSQPGQSKFMRRVERGKVQLKKRAPNIGDPVKEKKDLQDPNINQPGAGKLRGYGLQRLQDPDQ